MRLRFAPRPLPPLLYTQPSSLPKAPNPQDRAPPPPRRPPAAIAIPHTLLDCYSTAAAAPRPAPNLVEARDGAQAAAGDRAAGAGGAAVPEEAAAPDGAPHDVAVSTFPSPPTWPSVSLFAVSFPRLLGLKTHPSRLLRADLRPRPPQGEKEGEDGHRRAGGAHGSPGETIRSFRLPLSAFRFCSRLVFSLLCVLMISLVCF